MPLSNNIIQSRIKDLSSDVLDQVIAEIKASSLKISLQLDESTDVENCSQLIVLVRYVHDGSIKEDFLFCEDLKRTTKGKDIFQCVIIFFAKHDLDMQVIGSVFTEGAPAMLGNKSVCFCFVKTGYSACMVFTVFFVDMPWHQSKTLPSKSKNVLDICVRTID